MRISPGITAAFAITVAVTLLAPTLRAQPAPAPITGDAASGEFIFDDKCGSCHMGNDSTASGPSLVGVAGRKAASVADYRYTPALTAANVVWDDATLDRFLTHPQQMVPGTNMKRELAEPADRADVIAYLHSLAN